MNTRTGPNLLVVVWLVLVAGAATAATNVSFIAMPVPVTDEERASLVARAEIELRDGARTRRLPLVFHPLFETGASIAGQTVGGLVDARGRPLIEPGRPGPQLVSGWPDGTTIQVWPGEAGLVMLTQFEAVGRDSTGRRLHGRWPMAMGLSRLVRDGRKARLRVARYTPLDMSAIGGLWTPCAASRSPWGSHLAGEEYEPDARTYERDPKASAVARMQQRYRLPAPRPTAYGYGHIIEINRGPEGRFTATRHPVLGRFSHELAVVMPDRRTVYLSDDHDHGALFMFIADRAGDLTAGTLYAARWHALDEAAGRRARLGWVRLGHASDAEVAAWGRRFSFSTIFASDLAAPWIPGLARNRLKVRRGMARVAAFLESRRYAHLRGATTEFSKLEGMALDPRGRRLYVAISRISGGMLDEGGGARDQIRLPAGPAGAVFALGLGVGGRDESGRPIASDWLAHSMTVALEGRLLPRPDAVGDRAAPAAIANPDNLAFSASLRTLFIGEDSGRRLNNALWAYTVDDGRLTRIMTMPAGAEVAALHVDEHEDGVVRVVAGFQHAGAISAAQARARPGLAGLVARRWRHGRRAVVGYFEVAIGSMSGQPEKAVMER